MSSGLSISTRSRLETLRSSAFARARNVSSIEAGNEKLVVTITSSVNSLLP